MTDDMDIPTPPIGLRIDAATLAAMQERRPWTWRNCRGLTVSADFSPLPWEWQIGARVEHNCHYEFVVHVVFGPFGLRLFADIGNKSSENPFRSYCALSESEAWERAGK